MCFKGLLSFILRVAAAEADANSIESRNVFRPACSLWNLINHLQIWHVAFWESGSFLLTSQAEPDTPSQPCAPLLASAGGLRLDGGTGRDADCDVLSSSSGSHSERTVLTLSASQHSWIFYTWASGRKERADKYWYSISGLKFKSSFMLPGYYRSNFHIGLISVGNNVVLSLSCSAVKL